MDSSNIPASCIDWNIALESTGDDAELLDELVGIFMEESPMLIEQIHRGLDTKDAVLVQRSAHTLKGSLRIFHALSGAELAFQIEKLAQEKDLDRVSASLAHLEAFMERMMVELKNHQER
ncbi:MAG: Hpt domain-containing protein [Pirellulaceae bacterium]|jgi:HPt (histidine-containing phosphotransfer) domain-containing protein|nr:Hpt domain-containing protein [Pirellulaceae bacterium]